VGIPQDSVRFPNLVDYRYGMETEQVAALMTAMDVMLVTSYGEGFGVPTVEAQAVGTRVIGSNWAATPDLVAEDCFLVEGQPTWDTGQDAWWSIPLVPSIVDALNKAYDAPRGRSQVCIDFAQQFDVETVWEKHWIPALDALLA
jgi:glycosyltransferase involved in cell wall biosynthesis